MLSAMSLTLANDHTANVTDGDSRRATEGDRFRIRRSHLFTWLGVAIALFFAGVALGESDSVGAVEADGVLFGMYAQPWGGQSEIGAVQATAGRVTQPPKQGEGPAAAAVDRQGADGARSRAL